MLSLSLSCKLTLISNHPADMIMPAVRRRALQLAIVRQDLGFEFFQ